jgi:hypothetical protein
MALRSSSAGDEAVVGFLDTEAEVYVLFVAGVGVEVVRSATIELIALAKFASDEEAESYCAEAGGDPAYRLDEGCFLFAILIFIVIAGGEGNRRGDVLGCGVVVRGCGARRHVKDDSSGLREFDETVVLFDAAFVSSAL